MIITLGVILVPLALVGYGMWQLQIYMRRHSITVASLVRRKRSSLR